MGNCSSGSGERSVLEAVRREISDDSDFSPDDARLYDECSRAAEIAVDVLSGSFNLPDRDAAVSAAANALFSAATGAERLAGTNEGLVDRLRGGAAKVRQALKGDLGGEVIADEGGVKLDMTRCLISVEPEYAAEAVSDDLWPLAEELADRNVFQDSRTSSTIHGKGTLAFFTDLNAGPDEASLHVFEVISELLGYEEEA